ncbi:(deoxy)nucleoside triphosphate pyrophosphohydrolase [Arthrobacter sp. EH-1B-1]|uniref:8-oxo-dGTP diphosphatase n=1 Tax=Arthrobacter vasquezii TaxID=2977629 RepID=A0ABT6CW65_9MICC|nr:(deoxy)nucleoside triphosphate pyrophosphohydrolase [Arthrobacter vasquezii]MDF9278273.1 (deoxy)nucleoside triphosphate pyrophosphohydrolase [Arthrobacter vasquezii]
MTDTQRTQVVGAAIVDSLTVPSKLLAARRSAPEQFAGQWEFPGGKVEPDEDDLEAVQREVREELGVDVQVGAELVGPDPDGWPLNASAGMRVWLAVITAGIPAALQDHDELRWVSLRDTGELRDLPWIPADRPIVDALLETVVPVEDLT